MSTRVLIADPDESLLHAYRDSLSRSGFQVETACNGLECVNKLRDFTEDALVLELDMPWGGGVGVLAMMHDGCDLPHVPVMILTGRRNLSELDNLLLFEMLSEYHVKPLAPEQSSQLIRRMIEEPVLPDQFPYWGSPGHRHSYQAPYPTPKPPPDAAPVLCAGG